MIMRIGIVVVMIVITLNVKSLSKDLNGYYFNENIIQLGNVLQIQNDSLLIFNDSDYSLNNTDSLFVFPLATCRIDKLSDCFYEINSIGGSILSAMKNASVTADTVDMLNKSMDVHVHFDLPNVKKKLKLSYYAKDCPTENLKIITDTIIAGKCDLTIRNFHNHTLFPSPPVFYISPFDYESSSLFGQYYGVLYYEINPFFECSRLNFSKVTIHIPGITDRVLNQFFIYGEFIKVDGDTIIWRKSKYKKHSYEELINIIVDRDLLECY